MNDSLTHKQEPPDTIVGSRRATVWQRAVALYVDGFRSMRTGRKLWVLIIVKLLIIFGVLKLFFFPDVLKRDYSTDAERAEAVRTHLTRP